MSLACCRTALPRVAFSRVPTSVRLVTWVCAPVGNRTPISGSVDQRRILWTTEAYFKCVSVLFDRLIMQIIVGTTALRLDLDSASTPVVQNLGPGALYMDNDPNVTVSTGLKLNVGDVYEFLRDLNQAGGDMWLVADAANTDVRILVVG